MKNGCKMFSIRSSSSSSRTVLSYFTPYAFPFRMTNLSGNDHDGGEDGVMRNSMDTSLPGAAKRATKIQLPGIRPGNTRSLFIFSEDNFIRKYAQIIIEWIYPLSTT